MPIQGLMQIGKLAKKSDISVRSLRYYEELGLLKPERHSAGGFRLYSEENLKKLSVIKYLKMLGLSLEEIGAIFHSGKETSGGNPPLDRVVDLLKTRLIMTVRKIEELEAIRKEILSTLEILDVCRSRDGALPLLGEQRQICEKCDNLKARADIPKMLSMFF